MTAQKKRGRKSIGANPLTDTEKKRRFRTRQSLYVKAAKEHDYTPVTVIIAKQHMQAFEERYKTSGGSRTDRLSEMMFSALKGYFETLDSDASKKDDWPQQCLTQLIQVRAQDLFKQWEKQQ